MWCVVVHILLCENRRNFLIIQFFDSKRQQSTHERKYVLIYLASFIELTSQVISSSIFSINLVKTFLF